MTNQEAIENLKEINEKYHVPWHREAIKKAIEALEKQNHTCKNCGERDSDGWCKVVNVSCDVLEHCGCWSEVE